MKSGKKNEPEDQQRLEFFQVEYDQLNRKGIINRFEIIHHEVPGNLLNRAKTSRSSFPVIILLTERKKENYFE
jgi:hypothetical protein